LCLASHQVGRTLVAAQLPFLGLSAPRADDAG
jgi:hypothetical protein